MRLFNLGNKTVPFLRYVLYFLLHYVTVLLMKDTPFTFYITSLELITTPMLM